MKYFPSSKEKFFHEIFITLFLNFTYYQQHEGTQMNKKIFLKD